MADKGGAQIVYFSHGGGPLPLLGDPGHRAMVAFMRELPLRLRRPEAILVVSAHWEMPVATVLGARNPPMLYDYYGFPEEAYALQYPASGSPKLAGAIVDLLARSGIPSRRDDRRGFDHGLYVPLLLMYPRADIPALQLSLVEGLDPAAHVALGHALRELRRENVLVIGSGFSFHNMGAFLRGSESDEPDAANDAFQSWLLETCTVELPEAERERRLIAWGEAPAARYCHPREEHLLPLHVCLGMAGGSARAVFDDRILGKRSLGLLW